MIKTLLRVFRLYHMLYWALLMVVVVLTIPATDTRQQSLPFVIVLILAPPIYTSFFIYDYFFLRRKYMVAILAAGISVSFFAWTTQRFFMPIFVDDEENTLFQSWLNIGTFTGLALGLRSLKQSIRKQYQVQEARNRQLEAELALLRSQLNPHFLFNTLNNICALALDTPAEQPIFQLSELMRYVVEGSKQEWTELSRELRFLDNYIALERLRLSDAHRIETLIEGPVEGKKVAFFILIPFVENIFKHGFNRQASNGQAQVTVRVNNNHLWFTCWNELGPNHPQEPRSGTGTGLENVKKRLHLLYPNRHQLQITTQNNRFEVELHLWL